MAGATARLSADIACFWISISWSRPLTSCLRVDTSGISEVLAADWAWRVLIYLSLSLCLESQMMLSWSVSRCAPSQMEFSRFLSTLALSKIAFTMAATEAVNCLVCYAPLVRRNITTEPASSLSRRHLLLSLAFSFSLQEWPVCSQRVDIYGEAPTCLRPMTIAANCKLQTNLATPKTRFDSRIHSRALANNHCSDASALEKNHHRSLKPDVKEDDPIQDDNDDEDNTNITIVSKPQIRCRAYEPQLISPYLENHGQEKDTTRFSGLHGLGPLFLHSSISFSYKEIISCSLITERSKETILNPSLFGIDRFSIKVKAI